MNAASSLRFPTRFIAKERVVELTGEAYFEVAKNAKMPFKVVTSQKMTVEALGTKFDVMAYEDELSIKAALAEGSVRVTSDDHHSVLLSPFQLAEWEQGKSSLKVKEADLDKILAWKNGMIEFGKDDLSSIMRQLSRWYDVQVRFEGKISGKRYSGSIRRQSKLSQVLAILKEAGVECRLEGKILIVDQ
jgi:ferric-dicitrate binding protein FerR (iron transport regulator)